MSDATGLKKINDPPKRVLVGVVAIDRDHEHIDQVNQGIQGLAELCEWDLLVVTRQQDEKVQQKWSSHGAKVITIENYEIGKRHNLFKIAEKRNLVLRYGREQGYDAVLFIDSDIVATPEILADIFQCSHYADIVAAPYEIRWSGKCTVGLIDDRKARFVDARELMKKQEYPVIQGGGMGCTLIHAQALDVAFEPMQLLEVQGEDIGFFYKIYRDRPELTVRTTSWPHIAGHIM